MAVLDFFFGFDPVSLEELVRLAGFSALLDPEITKALTQAGELIVTTAQRNTWNVFDNPLGYGNDPILADTIYFHVAGPKEVDVAVGAIYGRRREMGFTGMTDSLGRFYASDPPKPYLLPAVAEDQELIMNMVELAVNNALDRVAVAGGVL